MKGYFKQEALMVNEPNSMSHWVSPIKKIYDYECDMEKKIMFNDVKVVIDEVRQVKYSLCDLKLSIGSFVSQIWCDPIA
jgi:hypothetical protein